MGVGSALEGAVGSASVGGAVRAKSGTEAARWASRTTAEVVVPTLTAGRVTGAAMSKRRGAHGEGDATHGETGLLAPVEAAAAIRGPCGDARQIFAVIVY